MDASLMANEALHPSYPSPTQLPVMEDEPPIEAQDGPEQFDFHQ
jgi:hypothetical protein